MTDANHSSDLASLLNSDFRKELIDYAKWIVNLASFFLTASLGYAGFFRETLTLRPLFYLGWGSLTLCIAMNWLIVKRLIALPIVQRTGVAERSTIHYQFLHSMRNLTRYGTMQNLLFVFGCTSIVFAIAWNASFDDPIPHKEHPTTLKISSIPGKSESEKQ